MFMKVSATLNYLEACHHKFSMSLANIDGKPQPVSKYNQYIDKNRDKQVLHYGGLWRFMVVMASAISNPVLIIDFL